MYKKSLKCYFQEISVELNLSNWIMIINAWQIYFLSSWARILSSEKILKRIFPSFGASANGTPSRGVATGERFLWGMKPDPKNFLKNIPVIRSFCQWKVPSTVVMIAWHWFELFDPLKLQGLPNLSPNRGPNYQESQVLRWATHQKDAKSSLTFKKFLPFVSEDQLIIWWTRLSLKETVGSFTGF